MQHLLGGVITPEQYRNSSGQWLFPRRQDTTGSPVLRVAIEEVQSNGGPIHKVPYWGGREARAVSSLGEVRSGSGCV